MRSNFAFTHTKVFDESAWKQIRADARKAVRKDNLTKRIIATDIDPEAIDAAKQNAKTAGVDHLIDFDICDFAETTVPSGDGIVLMNPEYGLRLGDTQELEIQYKLIGDFLKKKCPGLTGYVFTASKQLAVKIGLKPSAKTSFYNGKIPCRLLKYELYKGTKLPQ